MRASIVVPTFREASNLPVLARRIARSCPGCEILVVDDDSPDGTAEVARRLGARVIVRRGERGLATAVLRGLEEAGEEIGVVLDADLSHPPESIPALVAAVEAGADVAVGSRYGPGGEIEHWPLARRIASFAGTLLARPITTVSDPMSGFFSLRRSILEGATLRPQGFKILLEILARAPVHRVVEVPIRFEDRAAGASKFGPAERRAFLRQVMELYRERKAWPWRLMSGLGRLAGR